MAKFRFHRFLALAVAGATAIWVATGQFSSVGSAADEAAPGPTAASQQQDTAIRRTVGVVSPPRVEHARAIRISGYTDADKRAALTARGAGIIEELPVRLGTRVEAGDLVAKLEGEGRQAAVETARALLAQREAEAEAAERLARNGNLARLQLDSVRSALAQARSQLEVAQADLARIEVRAPFAGIIDKVPVELGSAVQAGAEVATILSLDPMLARGEVNERDLGYIRPGAKAEVRLVNGETVEGEIRYISRDATSATRTFRVEIAMPNPDRVIPAGMTAEITLRADPVEAVVLPRSVVTLGDTGDLGVRTVDASDKVVFYPIDLVDDTPGGLVLGGIPAGARIIVSGQELTSEGDTVNPVAADPADMAAQTAATGGIQ